MNEYEKQANDFLKSTKTKISVNLLFTGKHFEDDEQMRDVYEVTISNEEHTYTFNFGASIYNSGKYNIYYGCYRNGKYKIYELGFCNNLQGPFFPNHGSSGLVRSSKEILNGEQNKFKNNEKISNKISLPLKNELDLKQVRLNNKDEIGVFAIRNNNCRKPTAYEVLSCLNKYEPSSFEDFCSDFGYNIDSKKAEKIYFAVQKEWANLNRLFTEEQLNELREIQ